MKKLALAITMALTASSVSANGFFDSYKTKELDRQATENTGQQQPQQPATSNREFANRLIGGAVNIVSSTAEDREKARQNGLSVEEQKLKEKQDFLREQISKQRAALHKAERLSQFEKADKKITLGDSKYVDLFIPYNAMSNIEFDTDIKEMSFLEQPNIVIRQKSGTQNKLEILNKQPNLSIKVSVTFVNDKQYNFIIQTGDISTQRYVDYKIFTDNRSLATKTLFVKPIKMKHIHNEFNNNAIYLILSRIKKNEFYQQLRDDMYPIDKVLFSGPAEVETLYGMHTIDYSLVLNNVYESPFLQADTKNSSIKKRLVMMEATVTNNSDTDTLTVNEQLIKNRFGNYVAFYLGNLDEKENVLSPKQDLRMLLVIEDVVQ
mgnify:CR=1 FL=1